MSDVVKIVNNINLIKFEVGVVNDFLADRE